MCGCVNKSNAAFCSVHLVCEQTQLTQVPWEIHLGEAMNFEFWVLLSQAAAEIRTAAYQKLEFILLNPLAICLCWAAVIMMQRGRLPEQGVIQACIPVATSNSAESYK